MIKEDDPAELVQSDRHHSRLLLIGEIQGVTTVPLTNVLGLYDLLCVSLRVCVCVCLRNMWV